MNINVFITVVVLVAAVLVLTTYIVKYLRTSTMESIRADVYDLFLRAEHTFTETKAGQEKMRWVITKARKLLPEWAQLIITDEILEKVVQEWFVAVKALLDDGKMCK